MGTLAAAAATPAEEGEGLGRSIEGGIGVVPDSGGDRGNIVKSVAPSSSSPSSTTTNANENPSKAKKGYMYRPTNYQIGRVIETPLNIFQELPSHAGEGEGGAKQQLRVRNKFHAWHLRKLLWRKESERRANIKKGRGKKKKRQMGG